MQADLPHIALILAVLITGIACGVLAAPFVRAIWRQRRAAVRIIVEAPSGAPSKTTCAPRT
ncbi:hypothetical protein [Methylobacterium durans]|uniref:Uncharacterized protein n=1 Tax=Methylobacterium durans TaxID=2202825 RepID=A0A2U8WCB8_9HYPH|nr:hypothetical protein [Methylobacterium durans]AWN43805.1 hypothetical protein DK389_28910 [Methylobacterium durans]